MNKAIPTLLIWAKPTLKQFCCLINSLTIDDKCTHHAHLAACYQLVQTVLKIEILRYQTKVA